MPQRVIYKRVTSEASGAGIEVTHEKDLADILISEMLLHIAKGLRLDGVGRDRKPRQDT
jgi:hypothetical protein